MKQDMLPLMNKNIKLLNFSPRKKNMLHNRRKSRISFFILLFYYFGRMYYGFRKYV